jgi:hypothetical protein
MPKTAAAEAATPISFIVEKARQALLLQRDLNDAKEKLEQLKPIFRNHKQNIEVPVIGRVLYASPGGNKVVPAHTLTHFDETKFAELTPALRDKLVKLGVVRYEHVPETRTKKTAAAITFQLNA